MLLYCDGQMGTELLNILNTEDAFGTLPKCLKRLLTDIEEGLKNDRSNLA